MDKSILEYTSDNERVLRYIKRFMDLTYEDLGPVTSRDEYRVAWFELLPRPEDDTYNPYNNPFVNRQNVISLLGLLREVSRRIKWTGSENDGNDVDPRGFEFLFTKRLVKMLLDRQHSIPALRLFLALPVNVFFRNVGMSVFLKEWLSLEKKGEIIRKQGRVGDIQWRDLHVDYTCASALSDCEQKELSRYSYDQTDISVGEMLQYAVDLMAHPWRPWQMSSRKYTERIFAAYRMIPGILLNPFAEYLPDRFGGEAIAGIYNAQEERVRFLNVSRKQITEPVTRTVWRDR